jgi:GntR family transcriptional regulator, rspAB operon transcriptional repressor
MTDHKKKAYENLRYKIITQELPPGELLKEKELMDHYNIGRTPLRDIFVELQRQGLIRRVPRAGTWVAPIDLNFVKQLAEIRVPLEGLAGELAALRITEEQIQLLQETLEKAEIGQRDDKLNLPQLMHYESRFHHTIYAATGNQKLEELLLEYQSVSSRLWHTLFFTGAQLRRMFDDQQKILDALKSRNGSLCRKLMEAHTQTYFGRINGMR